MCPYSEVNNLPLLSQGAPPLTCGCIKFVVSRLHAIRVGWTGPNVSPLRSWIHSVTCMNMIADFHAHDGLHSHPAGPVDLS